MKGESTKYEVRSTKAVRKTRFDGFIEKQDS